MIGVDGRRTLRGAERTFEVVAWLSERRLVLYVPEIEAATSVTAHIVGGSRFDAAGAEAEAAARSLIADLTGLDPALITCDIRIRRSRSGP